MSVPRRRRRSDSTLLPGRTPSPGSQPHVREKGRCGIDHVSRPKASRESGKAVCDGVVPLEASSVPVPPVPSRPVRKIAGKRSNPSYTQFSAFIPTQLYRSIKVRAFLNGEDLSTMVERGLRIVLAVESEKHTTAS